MNFSLRLLQGSPEVLALPANNPFPEQPTAYIRAQLYDYHFTTSEERRRTGAWWKREVRGSYLPPISLRRGCIDEGLSRGVKSLPFTSNP